MPKKQRKENREKENLILIGFMGCGKTTTGLRLSYRMKMPVEDTDKMIEQKAGKTISEIFATEGEAHFRSLETQLLREIKQRKYFRILSVGGGTPVNPVNRQLLRDCGTVVYLRIQPETVYERLRTDTTRPLLQCENPLYRIRSLMQERSAAYEECADIIVDVDELTTDEVLDRIMDRLHNRYGGRI